MVDFLDEVKADAVEAANEIPTEEKLAFLAKKAEDLIVLEDAIAEIEENLAEMKRQKRVLDEVEIPDIMNEIGMTQFKLSNGLKLTVKPVFRGKINEENADEAFAWLESQGHGGIVKGQLIVEYRLNNKEDISKIAALADELEYSHRDKLDVHFMTLSAFLKDQITSGMDVPRDLLGVWTGFSTKISR